MRHAELLDRLGGYRAVAGKLGRDPSTVFRWQATGIPPVLWPAVLRLARGRVKLTVQDLEAGSPLLRRLKQKDHPTARVL